MLVGAAAAWLALKIGQRLVLSELNQLAGSGQDAARVAAPDSGPRRQIISIGLTIRIEAQGCRRRHLRFIPCKRQTHYRSRKTQPQKRDRVKWIDRPLNLDITWGHSQTFLVVQT